MATPNAARYRDLEQIIKDLQSDVAALKKGAQSTLSAKGGILAVRGAGDLQIQDNAGIVVWSALAGPIKTGSIQQDLNSVNLAGGYTTYLSQSIAVPTGYTQAFIFASVNAGTTISTGAGQVGCVPVLQWPGGAANGSSMANGTPSPGPVSVAASTVRQVTGIGGPGGLVTVSASAYSIGTATAGTGNVHLTGFVFFLR